VRQTVTNRDGIKIVAYDPPIPLIPFDAPLTLVDVISQYRAHVLEQAGISLIRSALRGKNLACWCPLDQPCHADVLLEIANRPLVCEAA
jgi:hypothetical protein